MVAKKIFTDRVGIEGGAYIAPNALKIVPTPPQRLEPPNINRTIDAVAVSGKYKDRFNVELLDVNIVSVSGKPVSIEDFS